MFWLLALGLLETELTALGLFCAAVFRARGLALAPPWSPRTAH
jgi:hypothetical protein